jgi:hypothetical protein
MHPAADGEAEPEVKRAARWFRELWLSSRDYARLMDRVLGATGPRGPGTS